MLIRSAESVLVVIDIQERLLPAMRSPAQTVRNTRTLLAAAQETGVPVLITEQYPEGLGPTVADLSPPPDTKVLTKTHFSCMEDATFADAFRKLGRKQAVLAGIEAHICVTQTAAGLIEQGYEVFLVSDATSSRTAESEQAAVTRLAANGAGIVTTEMVVFEWLGQAGTPAFKKLLPLIK
ncbi:hydrolase [Tropicimonas isoalkanivorans]|uniref:Nicotinamidase-related amidase n=1 Tax=Tropicimonas isoalkanivorans TaxID=441112 RepID=A0A1I1EG66_9RHOB|nr:hydrolase [Tropicimonas isoalkanivorans]SFB86154.1 Nicotinamidase-related amidase [Tropicimonas isoalkanivorans]